MREYSTPPELVEPHFPQIKELILPMGKLVERMREPLEAGKYNLIIGEDASGRIPALIMKKVIDHIYVKHGHTPPSLHFAAGYGNKNAPSVKDKNTALQEIFKKFSGSKALVITEHIASGTGVEALEIMLNEIGIECDFAVVSTGAALSSYGEIIKGNIYTGEELGDTPSIYREYHLQGVQKDRTAPLSARVYPFEDQTDTRTDAKLVADILIDGYENPQEKT